MLLEKSLKKGCNNPYFLPKIFHRSSKSNSYLISISSRSQVNLSTPTFDNINPTETIIILLPAWKFNQTGWNNLYFHPKFFKITSNSNTYLIPVSRRGPVNLSTETFPNINLTQPKWNFFFAWKINPKWLQKSLFTLVDLS